MDGIINVRVNGYSIVKDNNCAGAQFEANSTRMRIEFSRDWDGFVKTVTFWDALGRNPVKVILDESLLEDKGKSESVYLVPIAGEAMTEAGVFPFTIDGYDDGVRKRTVEEKLKVLPSRKEDHAGDPQEPTPTQAEQLQKEIAAIQAGKADKTEIPTNIDGLLRENESIVWCGNTDPQDIGYSIWLDNSTNDKQIIKVQDADGNWVDAMAGKADITWIEEEYGCGADEGVYAQLDRLTEDGIYGLRRGFYHMGWNYPNGPGDPYDYVNLEPFGDEYVIVTTHKESYPYLVKQWYFGAEQGMKLRSGTIAEDGTVTWEDWKCDSDFATKPQLEETFAKKADITWIDIEVDAYATDLKGSSGYPEELDTIADDGFYGIRVYQILHGGEDGNEEIHYSLYNEYLMVSKGESGVAQMYIDADKGIRIRNGKKKSDGTITWEMWNQQFDYVDKTTDQDIDGRKVFHQEITVPSIGGMNPDLTIACGDSLNLTANSGDVNINARNGVGNVNINGSVLAQDGIATDSVTSLDGHLELVSDDMDITAGGQICMNGSTGISINCPGGIRIESKNSSINLKGDVQVDGMLVLLDTVGGAVSLSAGEIGSLPILFDENATNLVAVIQNLQAQVVALTQRVTALETVNQDLENIIALQQSYIGGDEA